MIKVSDINYLLSEHNERNSLIYDYTYSHISTTEMINITNLYNCKLGDEFLNLWMRDHPFKISNEGYLTKFVMNTVKNVFGLLFKIIDKLASYVVIFFKNNTLIEKASLQTTFTKHKNIISRYAKLPPNKKKLFDSNLSKLVVSNLPSYVKLNELQKTTVSFCNFFKYDMMTYIENEISSIEGQVESSRNKVMTLIPPSEYKQLIELGIEYSNDKFIFNEFKSDISNKDTLYSLGYHISKDNYIDYFNTEVWKLFKSLNTISNDINRWKDKLKHKEKAILSNIVIDETTVMKDINQVKNIITTAGLLISPLRNTVLSFIDMFGRIDTYYESILNRIDI